VRCSKRSWRCAGYRVGLTRRRICSTITSACGSTDATRPTRAARGLQRRRGCAARDARRGGRSVTLTYFEFGTLSALWVFRACRLDALILEVGLGGRPTRQRRGSGRRNMTSVPSTTLIILDRRARRSAAKRWGSSARPARALRGPGSTCQRETAAQAIARICFASAAIMAMSTKVAVALSRTHEHRRFAQAAHSARRGDSVARPPQGKRARAVNASLAISALRGRINCPMRPPPWRRSIVCARGCR